MKTTDLPDARSIMTTLNEAKEAVEQGHTVHWKSDAYTLRKDSRGKWWVDSITGFVTPLSGHKPKDFYIGKNGAKNGATHAPTVTRPGGMSPPLQPYHVLLFINGRQCGDNQSFIDWYADDESAIADAHAYFTDEGYRVDDVTASFGEVRPANRFVPSLNGRILTVRLTTPSAL